MSILRLDAQQKLHNLHRCISSLEVQLMENLHTEGLLGSQVSMMQE